MHHPTDIVVTIDKATVATLPPVSYDGEIVVVDKPDLVGAPVADLRAHTVIGFDTETRPSFTKGRPNNVALMQLATPSRCYLFRLNLIGMPAELQDLIEDPQVKKIGLSVHDDFRVLHRSSNVAPQSFVDLQELVKQYGILDISLQKIYAILFGSKISKGQRLTNWEAASLTRQQQSYAAIDAWACLRIYSHLQSGAFAPEASPYAMTLAAYQAAQEAAQAERAAQQTLANDEKA